MAGAQYVVRTTFTLSDQMTVALQRARAESTLWSEQTTRNIKRVGKQAQLVSAILKSMVISRVVSRGLMTIENSIGEVVRQYVDMDQALVSAGAKFPEKVTKGTEAFETLQKAVRKVGAETEFTATEASQGLEFLALAGYNTKQSIALLPGMVDLATAANMDFARASDIASDSLGAFGLYTQGMGSEELAANMNRVSDVMAKTVRTSNTTLEQMFQTVRKSGPSFAMAGQSIETFSALLGTMANAGVKSSVAGTTLKNAMTRLTTPPKEAADMLKKYNIEVHKAGKTRDLLDVLEDMKVAFDKMTEQERGTFTKRVFGAWALQGMSTIMRTPNEVLRKYRDNLTASVGETKELADEMRKGLGNRLKILRSRFIEFGMKIMDAFGPRLSAAIELVISKFDKLDPARAIAFVEKLISGAKWLYTYGPTIAKIFIGWKIAIKAYAAYATIAFGVQAAQQLGSFKAALDAVKKSQLGLNAAAMANPYAIIIGLIIAAVAALVYMAVTWEEKTKSIGDAAAILATDLGLATKAQEDLWHVLFAENMWTKITNGFREGSAAIRDMLNASQRAVIGLINSLITLANMLPGLKKHQLLEVPGQSNHYMQALAARDMTDYTQNPAAAMAKIHARMGGDPAAIQNKINDITGVTEGNAKIAAFKPPVHQQSDKDSNIYIEVINDIHASSGYGSTVNTDAKATSHGAKNVNVHMSGKSRSQQREAANAAFARAGIGGRF
jgi:TP901 family phage tail tape measure protein